MHFDSLMERQVRKLTGTLSRRMKWVRYLEKDPHEHGQDIALGMSQDQKMIPSKYFYNAEGSRLYEAICSTPEYYLTGTELSILDERAAEIMEFFSREAGDLVELGSGSNLKIRKLLNAAGERALAHIRYVPMDISESAMLESTTGLLELFGELKVLGILADFTKSLSLLPKGRKLIAFLGSSIGNFTREERIEFLRNLAQAMDPGDRFLLGLDMVKPSPIIEAAYNDRDGITERFNRNILRHVNWLLNADFVPEDFEHLAFFRGDLERVEMHLRSRKRVRVNFQSIDMVVDIQKDETILTEVCQKFTRQSSELEFTEAGFTVSDWFTDPREHFSVVLLAGNTHRPLPRIIR